MERFIRYVKVAVVGAVSLLLLSTFLYLCLSKYWDPEEKLSPREAFIRGSIGTELAPLPVFVALPTIFPELFQPRGVDAGQWYQQFGMNNELAGEHGLPTGFFVSNKRPKSAAPSPVSFVGISCVMCHSTEIRKEDGTAEFVVGPGNSSLNLFAWLDAFQTAILDERLTLDKICEVYQQEVSEKLSLSERLMVRAWLSQTRRVLEENRTKFGDPYEGMEVFKAENVPTGPARTQPFRTLVRRLLHRPGSDMHVYTKVSTVLNQDRREWAQVDGSIRDLHGRSSVAAFAAGATQQNMRHPEIVRNIRNASEYTRDLSTPKFAEMFPELASSLKNDLIQIGRQSYKTHCATCHGMPSKDGWQRGTRQGEIVPVGELGTDPERVTFRLFEEVPNAIVRSFPPHHPFHLTREEIRPEEGSPLRGYINAPIERSYLRAPYLHNGSVLTLAELINLEKRRRVFYRGQNRYDIHRIGLASPDQPTSEVYFRFDTSVRGNSNRGHDYPWRFDDPDRDEEVLTGILEFLKTL